MRKFLLVAFWGLAMSRAAFSAESPDETDRTALAVEALTRLDPGSVDQNPKLKETLLKVLERTRGTPNFVRLVQHFKIKDQEAGLLKVAIRNPSSETGVEAMRLVLAAKRQDLIQQQLVGSNISNAVGVAEAIGNTSGKEPILALLTPLLTDLQRDSALRRQAVRSLARLPEGAAAILKLVQENKLPADLKFMASSELGRARWPEIKQQAAKLLPLPQGQNAAPLPPMAELMAMKGDAVNGAKVFSNPNVGCNTCHQVKGQGIDFGPNLSEIGTKLGKDALFEAILDPSAGISFGYEAWQLQLKSGDEAFGLIASETADELAIKAVGGIITRYKKSEITKREQSKLSIMPVGLQQSMATQELVDLVEYLSTLKK